MTGAIGLPSWSLLITVVCISYIIELNSNVCSLGWTSLQLSVSKIRRMHGAEARFLLELGLSNTR